MTDVRRKPGPAPRINRESVLEVARRLSPERMTMSAIGAELGVTAPALYRYFPDRGAIVDALARERMDLLEPPDENLPWREWLHEAARRQRRMWAEHPEVHPGEARAALALPGAAILQTGVGVLGQAGVARDDALSAILAVMHLACSVGISEAVPATGSAPVSSPDDTGFPVDLLEHLAVSADERFDQLVAVVIDGIDARRQAARGR